MSDRATRRRQDASRFLDLYAGADRVGEEEEAEEGEEDIEGVDQEHLEPFVGGPDSVLLHDDVDLDAAADALRAVADNIKARSRRLAVPSSDDPSVIHHNEYQYLLQDQADLPGPDAVILFSVHVKVNVFYLTSRQLSNSSVERKGGNFGVSIVYESRHIKFR